MNNLDYEEIDPEEVDGICPKCGQPCKVEIVDGRFTHEFGISGYYGPASECCGAAMYSSDMC